MIAVDGPSPSRGRDVATAAGLASGAAVALGFSRFAYALLLPAMRDALGLSYAEAGSLNTANGVGYVVGAIASAAVARRFGAVRTFQIGLIASVAVLLATAGASSLVALFVIRTVGGFTTALLFIVGASLAGGITTHDDPGRSGLLVGIYVAGAGAGIVVSGLTIPFVLHGADGWRAGWLVLGAAGVVGLGPAWFAARRSRTRTSVASSMRARDLRVVVPTMIGYGLFGAGYAGYMTFVIALVRSNAASGVDPALFWVLLGLSSTVGTLLWGRLLGRMRGGRGPALLYAVIALGSLPLLIHASPWSALTTAIVFGGSVIAGPAAITIVAKQQLPPASLTFVVAGLTVVFALGQAAGPLLSGLITDASGSVAAGLWTSPVLLAIGAVCTVFQRDATIRS